MLDTQRRALLAAHVLPAMFAVLMWVRASAGVLSATAVPQSDEPDALRLASPCAAATETSAQAGDPVESNGLIIVLERADLQIGADMLAVEVSTNDGKSVTGAMTYLTIRMPAMDHGVSAYPAQEIGDGRYQAHDISLGMAGEWVVTVRVIRQGRMPTEATYYVTVGERGST